MDSFELIEDPYSREEEFNSLIDVQDRESGDTILHCISRLEETRTSKKMMTFFTNQIKERDISEAEKHNLINRINKNGETPLHIAITYFGTKSKFVETFLKAGIDTEIPDKLSRTALQKAAFLGDAIVTKKLLEYGANPNEKNKNGDTPLHFSLQSNNDITVKVVRILLKDPRTDVNVKNKDGDTPLHYFAYTTNSLKTLAAFMRAKPRPDPLIRNNKGLTPIDLMHRNGKEEYVSWLTKKTQRTQKIQQSLKSLRQPRSPRSPKGRIPKKPQSIRRGEGGGGKEKGKGKESFSIFSLPYWQS